MQQVASALSVLALGVAFTSQASAQTDLIAHGLASDENYNQYIALKRVRREWSSWDADLKADRVGRIADLAGRPGANAWAALTLGDLALEGDPQAGAFLLNLLRAEEDPVRLDLFARAVARAGLEVRKTAVGLLVKRLPDQLVTQLDVSILVQLARLEWKPKQILTRFRRALREAPPTSRIALYIGVSKVWCHAEPLLRRGGAEVASELSRIALRPGTQHRPLALHSIAAIGSAATPVRKQLLGLLPEFGEAVIEAIVGMGPAAEDTHAEILAYWSKRPRNLTWRAVYRLAPDDPRVLAGEDAVLAGGPKSAHWRTAIQGLALRRDPHEAFFTICRDLLGRENVIEETAHVLRVYASRMDRSQAMQSLYLQAFYRFDTLLVRRTATSGLGRSPAAMEGEARRLLHLGLRQGSAPGMPRAAGLALVVFDGAVAYPELRKALDLPQSVLGAIEALGQLGKGAEGALPGLKDIVAGAEIEGVDLLTARRLARQACRRIRADDPRLP
ncbi:MAG: hypothetical protein JKY65_29015 [Planctomycetes bacterium]|nr:hypothetical protein [Planctomycetota bacterium]